MIGAVRAHVDDKKELNMAYLPNLLGVVGGRCMTVKHTDTHRHTHIHTQTHTHTAGSPSQSVDVLSSPGFSGL